MNTQTVDLSTLSDDELQIELQKRKIQANEQRNHYKELVNECVGDIVNALRALSGEISNTKLNVFQDLKALMDTKIEVYGIKDGQQSHTFTDKNGNSVTYGFRIIDGWDDTANSGIAKVNAFLQSLASDEKSANLVATINRLLRKDAKGNLKASRVLELEQMAEKFNDPVFIDGVNIIKAAYKPVRSCFFVEASYTDQQGKTVSVPLSISAAEFPEGVNIDELFPTVY